MLSRQDKRILAYFEAFDRFLASGMDVRPLEDMKRYRGQILGEIRKRQEEEADKLQKKIF